MKNSFLRASIIAAMLMAGLSACGKAPEKQAVTFSTLEDARSQARANAEVNARLYGRENPRLAGLDVVGHGDSTQTDTCPQGDGWASLSAIGVDKELLDAKGKPVIHKYKMKCSTVSANLGCYTEEDFKTKVFSSQENQCDVKLPFPLPKVVGK